MAWLRGDMLSMTRVSVFRLCPSICTCATTCMPTHIMYVHECTYAVTLHWLYCLVRGEVCERCRECCFVDTCSLNIDSIADTQSNLTM